MRQTTMKKHPDCESRCQLFEHKGYHSCAQTGRCAYADDEIHESPADNPRVALPDVTQAMVDRFLTWPLPESVCADLIATKQGYPHRSGTNLLTAVEARQMLEYVLDAAPFAKEVLP